ncbi:hypothetical protein HY772_03155 [Candidatus Woesearchaeota archaeon]|nr:hypothetical protein [Candidatus Woesearchaeota archaeon]
MESGTIKRIMYWSSIILFYALLLLFGIAARVHIVSKFFLVLCTALLSAHFRPRKPYAIKSFVLVIMVGNFVGYAFALSTFTYVLLFGFFVAEYFVLCEVFRRKIIDWGSVDQVPQRLQTNVSQTALKKLRR